jgi:hypothetical protein
MSGINTKTTADTETCALCKTEFNRLCVMLWRKVHNMHSGAENDSYFKRRMSAFYFSALLTMTRSFRHVNASLWGPAVLFLKSLSYTGATSSSSGLQDATLCAEGRCDQKVR